MLFRCLRGPNLSQELAAVTDRLLSAHRKAIAKKYSGASHISMRRSICSFTSQRDDSQKHQCKWQRIIPEIFTSQHGAHEKCGLYAAVKLNIRPLYTWRNTVNSPSQTQSKLPGDCHTTQTDLFPPFHRSDGSSSVKSLTKTGPHWVGTSGSFPPPTYPHSIPPSFSQPRPLLRSKAKFCPVPWLHGTIEPQSLPSRDECQACCSPWLC